MSFTQGLAVFAEFGVGNPATAASANENRGEKDGDDEPSESQVDLPLSA